MNHLHQTIYKKILIGIHFFLFLSDQAFSQDKIQFSGYGATGFIFVNQNRLREYNQQVYYEGKFQADIKVNKDIEAQLDFRGSSEEANVILREFSLTYEHFDKIKFKAGNIKKPFGFEQMENRENLVTVDRSFNQQTIEDFGYGGRSISIMAYYKYKKTQQDFPYSYYFSFYKDNSLNNGISSRIVYHFNNDLSVALNYQFQSKGGEEKISSNGVALDVLYDDKDLYSGFQIAYVQDPIEGIRRRILGEDEIVYAGGVKSINALPIKTGGSIVELIEPVLLIGFYSPDLNELKFHTVETLVGANFYFDKDMRLRINGDGLFTKNRFNEKYATIGSRLIIEIQVKF